MLSTLPVEILLEIIQSLPLATITALSSLSKSWATFMVTNESSIYHNISKRHGYASEGDPDAPAPSEGWKIWFIRKFQIELRWIGKLPGNLYRVKVPGKSGYFHRIKVDEEAGYIINTFTSGGLVVSDIHDHRILWSLDEEFCDSFVHCEHDGGYIVFNRVDDYKEVWRRRIDVLDIPEQAWPSKSHNKPDKMMVMGNRISETRFFDASRSRDPDHLRGQFVPWARLKVPENGRAFKLTRETLLVSSSQRAFLFDVEIAELRQTIELDALAGSLRYVDVSDQHAFIVSTLRLDVYDRATGSRVLSIPAGRQPWDFYAAPENQWRRARETFSHGELSLRRTAPSGSCDREGYFHAAHVSPCGKHLAIMAMGGRVILVQDFWRLFPTLSSSSPQTLVPSPVTLKDISKQVDFNCVGQLSSPTEGYLAYDRGKVAVMSTNGVYVLVLDSILDKLGEIRPLQKDTSLPTAHQIPKGDPSWPSLRAREVEFDEYEMATAAMFLCLQLSETKLYFSVLPGGARGDQNENMWCYDFASSPRFTTVDLTAGGDEEGDWDPEEDWDTEDDWDEEDWNEVEARLLGGLRRTRRR